MRNKLRRPLAFLICAVMIVTMWGSLVYAAADGGQPGNGLCAHHAVHTDECGYTEGTPGAPCVHEHTEDCYVLSESCVHEHTGECYPVSDGESVPAEAEGAAPTECTHVCSEESGCITRTENCTHVQVNEDGTTTFLHDENCGYVEAQEAAPCQFVCEECIKEAAEAGAETGGGEMPEPGTETESGDEVGQVPEAGTEPESGDEAGEAPEAGTEPESGDEAGEASEVGETPEPGTETESGAETGEAPEVGETPEAGTEPESGSETGEVPETEPENGTEAGEAPEAGQTPKSEPENGTEPETGAQEHCSCITICTDSNKNLDCPVCSGADADLSDCKGKAAEENTEQPEDIGGCKHHQEHDESCGYQPASEDGEGSPCVYNCRLCPIEDLITALPGIADITKDNAEEVQAQVEEILALFAELTEAEQGQTDLSHVYELQEALGNAPMLLAVHDTQQAGDEASVTVDGATLYYSTLEEAFAAADGKTAAITMLENAECVHEDSTGSPLNITGGNVMLDMNGKVLSGNGGIVEGIINVSGGSLSIQNGTFSVADYGVSCTGGTLTVDAVTFSLVGTEKFIADDGIINKGGTVVVNSGTFWGYGSSGHIYHYDGDTIIHNADMTETGENPLFGRGDSVNYYWRGTLTINGGSFGKIKVSDDSSVGSVAALLGEGYGYKHQDGSWATDEELAAKSLENVTVQKIPLAIDPQSETSWYYGSSSHTLRMNAQAVNGGEITYVWKNGTDTLDGTSDTYEIPADTPAGTYTYTCEASCDGYTRSHDFTFEILQSGAELAEGSVKTYKGDTETTTFVFGDAITVKAIPTATGEAPEAAKAAMTLAAPVPGQMAVFCGETQVSQAVDRGEDGFYTMTVNTAEAKLTPDTSGGAYTLTAKFAGDNNMAEAAGTVDVMIGWLETEEEAILLGTQGENGWYTSDVTVSAPDGYTISGDGTDWNSPLTISREGANLAQSYYLKNADGQIAKKSVTVNIDKSSPEISSALAEDVTVDTARITVEAADNVSGISDYKLSGDGISEQMSTTGEFSLSGLAPETEYELTVTVTDKAGKISTETVSFKTEEAIASVTGADGTVTMYKDLDEAAEAAREEAKRTGASVTLTLRKDVSGRTKMLDLSVYGGDLIFDLGGYTLSGRVDSALPRLVAIYNGEVEIRNGNVKAEDITTYAVGVYPDGVLSGNAVYSGLYTLSNYGIVSGGTFTGTCETLGMNAVLLGGTFTGRVIFNGAKNDGYLQGGSFQNATLSASSGISTCLTPGYVGYGENGKLMFDKTTSGTVVQNFTGEVKAHDPHTYEYTETEGENGTYTWIEGCPICGAGAPEGAGYTVTIPMIAPIDSDAVISVDNKLSQNKTVTVSTEQKQVTMTREKDDKQAQIVSDVTFEGLSAAQGKKAEDSVTFGAPVYQDDPKAVIPAGTYSGTLTFAIEVS